jgi:hypothetical protein
MMIAKAVQIFISEKFFCSLQKEGAVINQTFVNPSILAMAF